MPSPSGLHATSPEFARIGHDTKASRQRASAPEPIPCAPSPRCGRGLLETLEGAEYVLSVNKYTRAYMDTCRSKVAAQVSAYQTLVRTARIQRSADKARLKTAMEAFETLFFGNMVLVLDGYFVHRMRAMEGKDGNPLNEARMLCNSIMHDNNILSADKTIKHDSDRSVSKYRVGDETKLREADFTRLSSAFFAEMGKKFS